MRNALDANSLQNREILIHHDKMNEKCIQMIEAAVFLISFDESSPEGPEQRVRHLILNDGFNRWNDKSIAFVVCKNAASGTYVEHTMIDVRAALSLLARKWLTRP